MHVLVLLAAAPGLVAVSEPWPLAGHGVLVLALLASVAGRGMTTADGFTLICDHDERFYGCSVCWPVDAGLSPAFRGLAGEIVRSFVPYSEAHPVSLLVTFLTLAGNQFGPRPHAKVGNTQHPGRLNVVLVGETAVARKGVSWGEIAAVFEAAFPGWESDHVFSGFGSGEGLVARVAERMDQGLDALTSVRDPRLVVHENEFASLLRVANRDGNTLSSIVRDAWDGAPLQNNVKRGRLLAPKGHMVSVVTHITAEELRRELTRTDVANGLGNRFVFARVRRTRKIAHPKTLDTSSLGTELREVVKRSTGVEWMKWTDAGADAWTLAYDWLEDDAESSGGLVGPLLARGSAQSLRIAAVYALLDCSDRIGVEHVEAALALWRYCAESVRSVFGSGSGNPIADKIAEAVDAAPEGLTRTDISVVLGRNYTKAQIDVAVEELLATGRYRERQHPTAGRPATVLFRDEVNESDELRGVR